MAYKSSTHNTLRLHQLPDRDRNEYENYQFINQSSKASLKNLEIQGVLQTSKQESVVEPKRSIAFQNVYKFNQLQSE